MKQVAVNEIDELLEKYYNQGVKCKVPDCGNNAMAKELCSKHYQAKQRHEDAEEREAAGLPPKKRGPKVKFPEYSKEDRHPKLTLRLDPDLMPWVEAQGGARWIRTMMRELKQLSTDKAFQKFWKRLHRPTEGDAQ